MTISLQQYELVQGSPEWMDVRRTKITSTDAPVIMGVSRWKNKAQLYREKMSGEINTYTTPAMQRGVDLEPVARDLFIIQTGIDVRPRVLIKDWAMASVDGISDCGRHLVEIKCPSNKDHGLALEGRIPEHYMPQLQHQMYVCDVDKMIYFSFDGIDGVVVEVLRDDDYIADMINKERAFYECLITGTPPSSDDDYIQRDDDLWAECAKKWQQTTAEIKRLEKQEEELRKQLIFLSGESNTKGAGISLCQVQRKGSVDYSQIPELKGIDLEPYRKHTTSSWRICCL